MNKNDNTIIIKKITKKSAAHHGGAWKIAYADFVTAMMAFFLLLWLLASVGEAKLEGIAAYFSPSMGITSGGFGFSTTPGEQRAGQQQDNVKVVVKNATAENTTKMNIKDAVIDDAIDAENFTNTEHDLYKAIHDNPEISEFKDNIVISQTPEGLRIQILDDEKRPMFEPGTTILKPYMKKILIYISKYIRLLPNYLSIEGHTLSAAGSTEVNWEISAMRAEATRKFLLEGPYIDKEQIARIVGKGDQEPYDPKKPYSPSNMRVSMILLKHALVPYTKRSEPKEMNLGR